MVAGIAHNIGLEIAVNFSIQEEALILSRKIIPVVSMLGVFKTNAQQTQNRFKKKGDIIFLIGNNAETLSFEFQQMLKTHNETLEAKTKPVSELKTIQIVSALIAAKMVKTAHSISGNGLFAALIESCAKTRLGFDITTDSDMKPEIFLFGNSTGSFIVTVSPAENDVFVDFMLENKYQFTTLGHVTKDELRIDDISIGFINDIRKIYLKSLAVVFS